MFFWQFLTAFCTLSHDFYMCMCTYVSVCVIFTFSFSPSFPKGGRAFNYWGGGKKDKMGGKKGKKRKKKLITYSSGPAGLSGCRYMYVHTRPLHPNGRGREAVSYHTLFIIIIIDYGYFFICITAKVEFASFKF